MALPLAEKDSEIKVNNLKSKPYIDMTIQILKSFGITVENSEYNLSGYPVIKNISLITIQLKVTGVVVHFFLLQEQLTEILQ